MGLGNKCILLFSVLLVGWLAFRISIFLTPNPIPHINENIYWGPGNPKKDNFAIKPFKINISDKVLEDLNQRLDSTRELTPTLEGINFQYGFNSDTLKTVLKFWRNSYNWRDRETYFNQFPQYVTEIQGLKIHYLHIKPTTGHRTLPLLLLHGWPGSVREFYNLIPLLTHQPQQGADFVFELVIPSLPGYGFSEGASKPGLGSTEMGVIFKNLMKRLGHERFYVQGGDWGATIARALATVYPNNILGLHSNMCASFTKFSWLKLILGAVYPSLVVEQKYQHTLYPLSNLFSALLEESGYMHLQATKPDTLGVGLSDSPAGLAAYILEKFSAWTDVNWKSIPNGGLTNNYTYTDLLDNVMIYWVTNSITTSMRLYAEHFGSRYRELEGIPTPVPTACIRFRNNLLRFPDSLLKDKYTNLIQTTDITTGGHFAAFQLPNILADDIWKAMVKIDVLTKQK